MIVGVLTCFALEQNKQEKLRLQEQLLQTRKNQALLDKLVLINSMQNRCKNNSNINQQFLCDLEQEKERILKLIIPAKL